MKLSTGASGVGVASSIGLAFGAADYFGAAAPRVHISEGEGGLTPGRVAEALAAAGTASLGNAILHLDWNQASIDCDRVCRDEGTPGDYVQWDPMELFYLHDWNVVYVPEGHDFQQIAAAQRHALAIDNGQPTAIDLPHAQGLEVRHRGQGVARRRPQALLGRVLRGARRTDRRPPERRCRSARARISAAGRPAAT